MDEYVGGWPLRIARASGRGRYIVASRPVPAGEVVFSAVPYALSLKFPHLHCAYCYLPLPEEQGGIPCKDCGVARYCCAEELHKSLDQGHALVCVLYRRIAQLAPHLSAFVQAEVKIVLQVLCQAFMLKNPEDFTTLCTPYSLPDVTSTLGKVVVPTFEDIMLLCTNREKRSIADIQMWGRVVDKVTKRVLGQSTKPKGRAGKWVQANLELWEEWLDFLDQDWNEVLFRDLCNGYGLRDFSGENFAYGIYPCASYFNHSCKPNICRIQLEKRPELDGAHARAYDARLEYIAMHDIAEGEEVCISYIDTHLPTSERRELLSESYFFHCCCPRCEARIAKPKKQKQQRRNRKPSGRGARRQGGGRAQDQGEEPEGEDDSQNTNDKNGEATPIAMDEWMEQYMCPACLRNVRGGLLYPYPAALPVSRCCNACGATTSLLKKEL